ncbi:MAG TPA: sarcosine oxidase subunit delta [Burkholderiales bacterium]|nr:sarcosine oxidase subunit delta [Burkholderiales bacterium]
MMLLPCPYCGPRDVTEFSYGGDADVRAPAGDAPAEDWSAHVYLRDNPRGPHDELWQHSAGCRRWIRVTRNTLTHEVLDSKPAGQAGT